MSVDETGDARLVHVDIVDGRDEILHFYQGDPSSTRLLHLQGHAWLLHPLRLLHLPHHAALSPPSPLQGIKPDEALFPPSNQPALPLWPAPGPLPKQTSQGPLKDTDTPSKDSDDKDSEDTDTPSKPVLSRLAPRPRGQGRPPWSPPMPRAGSAPCRRLKTQLLHSSSLPPPPPSPPPPPPPASTSADSQPTPVFRTAAAAPVRLGPRPRRSPLSESPARAQASRPLAQVPEQAGPQAQSGPPADLAA